MVYRAIFFIFECIWEKRGARTRRFYEKLRLSTPCGISLFLRNRACHLTVGNPCILAVIGKEAFKVRHACATFFSPAYVVALPRRPLLAGPQELGDGHDVACGRVQRRVHQDVVLHSVEQNKIINSYES